MNKSQVKQDTEWCVDEQGQLMPGCLKHVGFAVFLCPNLTFKQFQAKYEDPKDAAFRNMVQEALSRFEDLPALRRGQKKLEKESDVVMVSRFGFRLSFAFTHVSPNVMMQ